MANILSQFIIIFRTSYSAKSGAKVFIIIVLLLIFSAYFRKCNQVPINKVNVTYYLSGSEYLDIDMTLVIANHSILDNFKDSTFSPSLQYSGKFGIDLQFKINNFNLENKPKMIKGTYPDPVPWGLSFPYPDLEWLPETELQAISLMRENYPDYQEDINNLNSSLSIYYSFDSNIKKVFNSKKEEQLVNKYFKEKDVSRIVPETGTPWYCATINEPSTRQHYSSRQIIAYRDSISGWFYGFSPYRNKGKGLFHSLIWEAQDISQSYVKITLKGFSVQNDGEVSTWYGDAPERCMLTLDFGTPVTFNGLDPIPDKTELTRVIYKDPEKIKRITAVEGLSFYVKYLENSNIQSMRMFWLTTIITALVTWLCAVIYRWAEFLIRRRRRLNKSNQ